MCGVIERILGCTLSGDLLQDLEDGIVCADSLANWLDPMPTFQETSSRQRYPRSNYF